MPSETGYEIAGKLIGLVRQKSKAACEVYFTERVNLSIKVYSEQVESLTEARSLGLGLRVIDNGREGFAFTSNLTDMNLEMIAEKALQLAAVAEPDKHNVLPGPQDSYPAPAIWDEKISATPITEKIRMTIEMESAALAYDPVIKAVGQAFYHDESRNLTIVNSQGLRGHYLGSHCLQYVAPVAMKDGEAQTSGEFIVSRKIDELDPQKIAVTAAAKAKNLLGGRSIKTATLPVIYCPKVAAEFLSDIASAVNAEAVLKGRSMFINKQGETVAASEVVLVDDGLLPEGIATAPFDDEGVVSQHTEVINHGVLQHFLHNSYTASRLGEKSTGNAVRSGYRSLPYIGTSNFHLKGGESSEGELIKSIDKGLFVERTMNVGGVNPVNGDYSVGAVGHYIENGEITFPVQKITVAGNLLKMLQDVKAIADTPQFIPTHRGVCGSPAILFGEMTISGAGK